VIAVADLSDEPTSAEGVFVVGVQAATPARAIGFERTYAAHYRDVFRYVLGLTRSAVDAEDITADTFERAFRHWADVPDRPVPWLLLTARRIATDRWRRARRLAALLVGGRADVSVPATAPSDPEFAAWFDSIARVLTARQREVLVLRYQRDLTDADIGSVMGLSESGVRSLLARALAVLRSHPELLQ
jgi:RNA polymerase sigma-70 factor (ECF subfamily)